MTAGLVAEHRAIEGHWRQVRTALARVVAGAALSVAADDFEALIDSYKRHIEHEEKELLPMAARLLSNDELERIGRAMRERRGIDPIV